MKKKLIILSLLSSLLLVSCNDSKTAEQTAVAQETTQQAEQAEQPVAAVVETTETPVENAQGQVEAVQETVEEAVEVENQYAEFQNAMVDKYKDKAITNITVSPYAKGIDIIFNTSNKNMTKDEFNGIASDVVKELKANFDFIPADSAIGCSLEYQPNPNENTDVLMTSDIK